LTVLLSVLLGVALFGYWGAVLAIPAAGSIQVIVTALWREAHEARLAVPEPDPD
jgi:predicted PurR-regulated permease PerM